MVTIELNTTTTIKSIYSKKLLVKINDFTIPTEQPIIIKPLITKLNLLNLFIFANYASALTGIKK